MSKWLAKAALQGVLSLLPDSWRWNYFFQRYVSRRNRVTDDLIKQKLAHSQGHLEFYYSHSYQPKPAPVVLELGTGWLPIVPVCLYLSGCSRIITVDINPMLRPDLLQETLNCMAEYVEKHETDFVFPAHADRLKLLHELSGQSLQSMDSVEDTLKKLNIEVLVCDARRLPLESNSIDLCVSNNTFEHIPKGVLQDILIEFRRILSEPGIMSHLIDMSDHYAHFDRSITPYNYLKFSGVQWRLINNSLQYQNRLRACDYQALHQHAGFEVVQQIEREGEATDLAAISLAQEFADYTDKELLPIRVWMASKPDKFSNINL